MATIAATNNNHSIASENSGDHIQPILDPLKKFKKSIYVEICLKESEKF